MLGCFPIEIHVVFSLQLFLNPQRYRGYLSTPPISEHRSALSTSGNMSNLRSARYTVVDLSIKRYQVTHEDYTNSNLTTLSGEKRLITAVARG